MYIIILCACLKSVEYLGMLALTFICWQEKTQKTNNPNDDDYETL